MAACLPSVERQTVTVAYVYDGDTVRLDDGRKIRLIGINTPETAKQDTPAEWLAEQAAQRLKTLLSAGEISLSIGIDSRDRYGRWLGHLWHEDLLLAEQLVQEGLAYQISIPPNLTMRSCLRDAEAGARQQQRGLWQRPVRAVTSLQGRESGFRVLQGRVTAVKRVRSGWIIELEDLLASKLGFAAVDKIEGEQLHRLLHKTVTVRGWVRPKSANAPAHYQPWFMPLSHLDHLEY